MAALISSIHVGGSSVQPSQSSLPGGSSASVDVIPVLVSGASFHEVGVPRRLVDVQATGEGEGHAVVSQHGPDAGSSVPLEDVAVRDAGVGLVTSVVEREAFSTGDVVRLTLSELQDVLVMTCSSPAPSHARQSLAARR